MRFTLLLLFGLSLIGWPAHALNRLWFSPGGTGDGTSREHPRAWNINEVNFGYLGRGAKDLEVEFNFLPGLYATPPINTDTTGPSAFRITLRGHGRRPEDTVLQLLPDAKAGASDGAWGWTSLVDLNRNEEYLDRFVAENLTMDCGWSLQQRFNHPGYLRAFKHAGIQVAARTGRIRRVLFRNYGSHGLMPQRATDSGSGAEIFPLQILTADEGQTGDEGDLRPWVVEDCEFAGLSSVYSGYGTMVMAATRMNRPGITPDWAARQDGRRLVQVSRVQVRGGSGSAGTIAFGTAAFRGEPTGKITFADNLVVSAVAGFNTDTGAIRQLDFTNSLLLGVNLTGALGQPDSGPNHLNYDISGNSIRLSGGLPLTSYLDFAYTNRSGRLELLTNGTAVLGRRRPPTVTGLHLAGAAQDVTFSGNWLAAEPAQLFQRQWPKRTGFTEEPTFELIHRAPDMQPLADGSPARRRRDVVGAVALDNRISASPWDFSAPAPVEGGRFAAFGSGAGRELQVARRPQAARTDFVPLGNVERVGPVFTNRLRRYGWTVAATNQGRVTLQDVVTNRSEPTLIGARELVLGQPAATGQPGSLTVLARLAVHPTPLAAAAGTRPEAGQRVWLELTSGSQGPRRLSAVTDDRGIATFRYAGEPGSHGVHRLRAWVDAGEGTAGELDEFQDVWCAGMVTHGTTVEMGVERDVADERFHRPALLRLKRSGGADTRLLASFAIARVNELGADTTAPDVEVRYGDRATIPLKKNAAGSWRVPFNVGETSVLVQIGLPEGATNATTVLRAYLRNTQNYAAGEAAAANLVIYNP